ncbi:MAG TPA: type II toxin-antitoxin system VapC family toxin [Blastocatellia bacterium]|nr:type II toxin-antitoxin system VapC family toxin [Blastocatellia bacterium]
MSLFVLDTGILVGYIRGAGYAEYVERTFQASQPPNMAVVSIISKAELYSLAIQFGWGEPKKSKLEELLRKLPLADINSELIIRRYAEIDAYSQCKDPTRPNPPEMSSRNMGKNDIWIAATASVLNATLLTTDHDFDHLNKVFLTVAYIDQQLTASSA